MKKRKSNSKFLISVSISIIIFCALCFIKCEEEIHTTIVTAQVAKTLAPESNTASVIIGRTTLLNVFIDQPGDTSFTNIFPVNVEPITGALVKINDVTISEKIDGVYFKPSLDLQFMQRYNLHIVTDNESITGSCVLPDSFSIRAPSSGDSVLFYDARVVWSKSDSAEYYIVGLTPLDTANKTQGWSKAFPAETTACLIPQQAFIDTAGNFYPGEYMISMMSFNGAWKKGNLDLILSGGNLNGAPGIYGAAVYTRSVLVNIKDIKF